MTVKIAKHISTITKIGSQTIQLTTQHKKNNFCHWHCNCRSLSCFVLDQIYSSRFPTSELFFGSDAYTALRLKEEWKEEEGEKEGKVPAEEIALIVIWQVSFTCSSGGREDGEMRRRKENGELLRKEKGRIGVTYF